MDERGAAWGFIKRVILEALSPGVGNAGQLAYNLVRVALDEMLSEQDVYWESYPRASGSGTATWVRRKPRQPN